jgi:hypothetical protein
MSTEVVLHEHGIHLPKPSTSKSLVRKYADLVTGGLATRALHSGESLVGVDHFSAFFDTIERTGVGGMTGAGLAFTSKMFGGLEPGGAPLDLIGSGLFSGIGVLGARTRIGTIARAMGGSAMTVFAFRKTEEWLGARKTINVHGEDVTEMGEDPIVEAAKAL